MRNHLLSVLSTVVLLLTSTLVQAQGYPDRPISLVVPFSAGSGTDGIARIIAERLSQRLGQPVVIENRPGANAQIGADLVARAEPDGYTLLMATSTSHSANPGFFKNLRYDPIKDFTPLARTGILPFILVSNTKLPVKSMQDLIDYARAHPDSLTASSSNGTALLSSEMLKMLGKIEFLTVPYKSAPQAFSDLLGGHIDMNVVDFVVGLPSIMAGKVQPLGVTMAKRSKLLPDVPAIAETIPGFDLNPWNGIFGPANLPDTIADKLATELQGLLAEKEIQDKLSQVGFDVQPSASRQEFAQYVKDQLDYWTTLIKQSGIQPE
ncbi:MAG TPA: tripartite tricarboxylate transporter substrate binding protein [Eoetvoesiella sp.]